MQQLQRIKPMYNLIRNSNNPQYVLQQIFNQNPQFNQIQSVINQYGNTKDAFYAVANQLGINPDQILSALQN